MSLGRELIRRQMDGTSERENIWGGKKGSTIGSNGSQHQNDHKRRKKTTSPEKKLKKTGKKKRERGACTK